MVDRWKFQSVYNRRRCRQSLRTRRSQHKSPEKRDRDDKQDVESVSFSLKALECNGLEESEESNDRQQSIDTKRRRWRLRVAYTYESHFLSGTYVSKRIKGMKGERKGIR